MTKSVSGSPTLSSPAARAWTSERTTTSSLAMATSTSRLPRTAPASRGTATGSSRAARAEASRDARVLRPPATPRAQGGYGNDAMVAEGVGNYLYARPGAALSWGAGASRLAVAPRHPPGKIVSSRAVLERRSRPRPRRRGSRHRRDLATDVIARPTAPIGSFAPRPTRHLAGPTAASRPGRADPRAPRRDEAATTTSRRAALETASSCAAASRDADAAR